MSQKRGKRISIRDCLLEELRVDYPELKCVRKKDPFSFSVWFKKMEFKTGWDYDEFWDQFGHLKARFSIRRKGNGILLEVSRFTGYIERREGE